MKLKKLLHNNGQSAIEFAFVCIFFFAILFALIDMVRICYSWVSLQYTVNEAARENSLGNDATASAQAIANALGLSSADVLLYDSEGKAISGTGNPLQFVRLRVHKQVILNLMSDAMLSLVGNPGRNYDIYAEAIIRNEPFR